MHQVDLIQAFYQALRSIGYYAGLILLMRLAGKRLAGQATTFDLLVLITLAVVLQGVALGKGTLNSLIFFVTLFAVHRTVATVCAKSKNFRRLIRGAPRPLIEHGRVSREALEDEGLSYDELLAGLRKAGHPGVGHIHLATLEETGHISVISMNGE